MLADVKILYNDWPYAMVPGMRHICVWSKVPIPTDPATGDLTPESRKMIQNYVDKMFIDQLTIEPEKVLWFKNWAALQSIRTVEHFHVLIRVGDVVDGEKKLATIAH